MKFSKILALFLCVVMILPLVSCGEFVYEWESIRTRQ